MALEHPSLDPFVAQFKLQGTAISLLRRSPRTETERQKLAVEKAAHPLCKDCANEGELLESLLGKQAVLEVEMAAAAKAVRHEENVKQRLADMAAAQSQYQDLDETTLEKAVAAARAEADAANSTLRSLLLEKSRRQGHAEALKQLESLNPQAREILKQEIAASAARSTTTVPKLGS